jgi:hypothetical protein
MIGLKRKSELISIWFTCILYWQRPYLMSFLDFEDSSWNTWGLCQNRFQMAWVGPWKPSQVQQHAWMTFLVWTYHLSEFRQLGKRWGSYIDYWNGRKWTDLRPVLWDSPSSLQMLEQACKNELQWNTHNLPLCFWGHAYFIGKYRRLVTRYMLHTM